jgi:endogenous inhibitor of DNA gyrase (YacG/DUF329 family)
MNPAQCPTCKKKLTVTAVTGKFYPFCSERCQMVDLGRWFNEDYRIDRQDEEHGEGAEDAADHSVQGQGLEESS